MKKSSFIFSIAFVLLSTFSALAQQPRDSKGHLILNAKGDIYFDGVKTGTVSKDKIISDSKGKKLGFLGANGILKDENGIFKFKYKPPSDRRFVRRRDDFKFLELLFKIEQSCQAFIKE